MGEFSSILHTKLLIPLACLARVWVGLLLCLNTWRKQVDLKECSLWWIPWIRFAMAIGGVIILLRASKTIHESFSKTTSLTPISHAKVTTSSIAFPFASKGPSGKGRCLLMVATIDPSWSRIKTQTPTELSWSKIATSTLTLYHGDETLAPTSCWPPFPHFRGSFSRHSFPFFSPLPPNPLALNHGQSHWKMGLPIITLHWIETRQPHPWDREQQQSFGGKTFHQMQSQYGSLMTHTSEYVALCLDFGSSRPCSKHSVNTLWQWDRSIENPCIGTLVLWQIFDWAI